MNFRAYQLLYRYTPLTRAQVEQKLDRLGTKEALEWADKNYNVYQKEQRDRHTDNEKRSTQ